MNILLSKINFRAVFPLLFFGLLVTSCKVRFVPDYDAALVQQIDQTSKMVDNFYLSMKASTTPAERQFQKYVNDYVAIEVELNSLLTKNKIRPLNESSTRIAEIALQIWNKYQAEHKADNKISDGIIKLNQKYMSDLFYAMRVAEEGKKMAGSSSVN